MKKKLLVNIWKIKTYSTPKNSS